MNPFSMLFPCAKRHLQNAKLSQALNLEGEDASSRVYPMLSNAFNMAQEIKSRTASMQLQIGPDSRCCLLLLLLPLKPLTSLGSNSLASVLDVARKLHARRSTQPASQAYFSVRPHPGHWLSHLHKNYQGCLQNGMTGRRPLQSWGEGQKHHQPAPDSLPAPRPPIWLQPASFGADIGLGGSQAVQACPLHVLFLGCGCCWLPHGSEWASFLACMGAKSHSQFVYLNDLERR